MVDSFGTALRQLRQDSGLSLKQLADKVNWSKPIVGLIETGERRASPAFAAACDRALGTAPILTTLCGLDGEDDDMRRRALLAGLTAAVGAGAVASYTALADIIRLDLQEAAGIDEGWDVRIADFQQRLAVEPSPAYGDELLACMLLARQQLSQRLHPDALRASAHLGLLYGLWMGDVGNIATGRNFYRTAEQLAARCDTDTQVYVLGRTAAAGPYRGLGRTQTQRHITQALDLAGQRVCAGALEVHAGQVQLAALSGDLRAGRVAVQRMWHIAERLPATTQPLGPAQRTVGFDAYLEGRLGTLADAQKAQAEADVILAHLPLQWAETRLYFALSHIRHGDIHAGLQIALEAARSLTYSVRVIRLGVDDVLTAVPATYRSELVDELRQHGTTGPRPWELMTS